MNRIFAALSLAVVSSGLLRRLRLGGHVQPPEQVSQPVVDLVNRVFQIRTVDREVAGEIVTAIVRN